MTQETISQRLKILIKALGLNPRSFSEKYGVNEGTTRGYTTRGSIPNADYIATLLRAIDHLNAQWLLLGEGEMFLTPVSNTGTNHIKANSGQAIGVNHGTATYSTLADCEKDLKVAYDKIELLESQLRDKERIIQLLELQIKK